MLRKRSLAGVICLLLLLSRPVFAQETTIDSSWHNARKNVIRYDLSGAALFGFDKYVVFGYERVVNKHQSFSINGGTVALPKLVTIETDSFYLQKDLKNNGFNISADYRFYLAKENRYFPPHGLYIGPWISYNKFTRNNQWTFRKGSADEQLLTTETDFKIFSVGGELGYQFIVWKRLAIDLVMIGPGISSYDLQGKSTGNLTEEQRAKLQDALKQLITQKFPGMNYVFADKSFDASGSMKTTSIGFRYIVHIGFAF
ncbi:hypothetical protein [Flavihumibacter petaseus]|uniref:DUF3575 domain-containing protein n=1 Tax=Flavihumibacter petaseus NBRC 106054 TaxID=1220578 RepID=A0A0E9N6Q2_9BACT|nr:hypothetical protein [Flavihumibacter petaseus]GAO45504.1 hypothetical protein FPE01S_05_01990 [Flavihumibacter petaseus NBRC 106054]